jgi:hypothetical protein
MCKYPKFLIAVISVVLLNSPQNFWGQDIKKDVVVVKSYQPVINDAGKINQMPVFNDSSTVKPKFDYTIFSSRLNTAFQPRPVNAAKMVPDPIVNLYNSYLKVGLGNPLAPLAELSISNTRSKQNSYGIFLHHYSSDGSVKLDNGKKVDAPFADNEVTLYGKHISKESVISGSLGYTSNKFSFYGYNPSLTNISLNKNDILQRYQGINSKVSVTSLKTDSNKLQYSLNCGYNYIFDNYTNSENHFGLDGNAGKTFGDLYLGAEASYNYYQAGGKFDTVHNGVFALKPFISKNKGNWHFVAGLDGVWDNNQSGSQFFSYPRLNFDFVIAPEVLSMFLGYQGFLEQNSLFSTFQINPYVLPGIYIRNANHKVYAFGGLRGSLSSSIRFTATASYSEIDNQYFFVNDSSSNLRNTFNVTYDNIGLFAINAEFSVQASEKLALLVKTNFRKFNMFKENKPWQMPNFDATATAKYNLRNKINLSTEIFISGTRYAKLNNTDFVTLKPYADFNLGIEYRYTKILSFFLQFKNLTAARYQIWNQYPVYRFQVMGGFTYSL